MNWDEYLQAKEALKIDDDNPPSLFMSGAMGDNGTRYLLNQKGAEFPNDENLFLAGICNSDFVWNGSRVRAHKGISTGGHPALAGFDTIYCAGRVKGNYFFFHSGHYHPKLPHALHFFSDFVTNTCSGMAGLARDQKVDQLCNIRLKLYRDDSETETYSTSIALLAAPKPSMSTASKGSASISIGKSIPRSMPMSMSGSSMPEPIITHFDESAVTLQEETGINNYGKHQLQVRIQGAPPWIDDSARTRCALCPKTFGVFTRKHHCRRCGEIVCADCSKHTKFVRYPAVIPKSTEPEKQPVRVCDLCFNTQDLI